MATAKADHVSGKLATDICEAEFGCRGPNLTINWLSVLTSEGVFRRDHIFDNKSGDPFKGVEEIYRFTYQRFSDHLIVKALIEKVDNIADAFRPGGPLAFSWRKMSSGIGVPFGPRSQFRYQRSLLERNFSIWCLKSSMNHNIIACSSKHLNKASFGDLIPHFRIALSNS